jgi:hypothetical protein
MNWRHFNRKARGGQKIIERPQIKRETPWVSVLLSLRDEIRMITIETERAFRVKNYRRDREEKTGSLL